MFSSLLRFVLPTLLGINFVVCGVNVFFIFFDFCLSFFVCCVFSLLGESVGNLFFYFFFGGGLLWVLFLVGGFVCWVVVLASGFRMNYRGILGIFFLRKYVVGED